MFFSSLLNSDFSFVCFPNFCHKKLFCFREYLFTDKNSALFIFQCTICLDSFSVNACPSGSLADSLIILPYYFLFVNTFFEIIFCLYVFTNKPSFSTHVLYLSHNAVYLFSKYILHISPSAKYSFIGLIVSMSSKIFIQYIPASDTPITSFPSS